MLKSLKVSNSKRGDILIPISVVFISLFGILMIYSASNYQAEITFGDKFYFVKKQALGFIIGLLSMIMIMIVDYKTIAKFRWVLISLSFLLLALVFTPLGVENYGAKRWIGVGSITIQPSEISKFSFVIFTASYFAKNPSRATTFKGILPIILIGAITCLLIMLEPNMSITVCVGGLMIAMLFVSGMKKRYLLAIIIPALIALPILILIEPYRLKRLMAFINPWASPKGEGYQLLQSLYALGSGGFFGVGLFNSRQKFRFLPFSESDFILSVIGEELGFIGVAILFGIMLFTSYRGYKTAIRCKTYLGFMMAFGITTVFLLQVLINALVVTGSIPPTGLPLPFVSCGNTSLIVFMTAFGILYRISKDVDKI
ncbi:MAG: putative lipid II flippase FtsW [Clostridiales bacterium]|nr:putative lipid II flippase FtsW [Clostridiales bacterium]